MQQIPLILILLLFGGIWGLPESKPPAAPEAYNGVLDLSAWDFERDGPVLMDGQWNFYWQYFLPVDKPPPQRPPATPALINVPATWLNAQYQGEPLTMYGYGTYELEVILNPDIRMLSFKLPTAGTSYDFYINGELIANAGQVGKTREQAIPQYLPQIINYVPETQNLHLLIHIANFHYWHGGLWYSLHLGQPQDIYKIRERIIQREFFSSGVFFIMFVLQFMLFLLRKNELLSLYFSLTCGILWIRQSSMGETIILNLLPDLSFNTLVKLEFGTLYLAVPLFVLFIAEAFPSLFNQHIKKIITYLGAGATLLVAVTPPTIFTHTLTAYQIMTVAGIFYVILVIVRAYRQREYGAGVLLVGVGVLFITTINDILYARELIKTGYWVDMGLLVFILSQSFLINQRYTMAFVTIKNLSRTLSEQNKSLADLTQNLEMRVEERTCELEAANKEIEKLAMTDTLTGISNRRALLKIIKNEEKQFHCKEKPFCLVLLDIDNFKSFNDTFGHDVGDQVLISVARVMKDNIRQNDHLARWGGEEFLILLPETLAGEAVVVVERVRLEIARHQVKYNGQSYSVTVTMGLCEYNPPLGLDGCLKMADAALYHGKHHGKNKVVNSATI